MDQDTFEKELEESLQKPDDWDTQKNCLTHNKTRIFVSTITFENVNSTFVFGPNGEQLATVSQDLVSECRRRVNDRKRASKARKKEEGKERFLGKFKGFS